MAFCAGFPYGRSVLLRRPFRQHAGPRPLPRSAHDVLELRAAADVALDLLQLWRDFYDSGMSQPDEYLLAATSYALQRRARLDA